MKFPNFFHLAREENPLLLLYAAAAAGEKIYPLFIMSCVGGRTTIANFPHLFSEAPSDEVLFPWRMVVGASDKTEIVEHTC